MMDDGETRAYCLANLQEASGILKAITKMVHSDGLIDEKEYKERMAHLYWCVNQAWNCRNEPYIEVDAEIVDQTNDYAEFYPKDLRPSNISN